MYRQTKINIEERLQEQLKHSDFDGFLKPMSTTYTLTEPQLTVVLHMLIFQFQRLAIFFCSYLHVIYGMLVAMYM